VQYHPSRNVISSDAKIIKMWNKSSGDAFTSIEPPAAVNGVCVDSGVVMVANEQHRMQAYYCPELGPAPTWAHFLDNLTEELEEQGEAPLYDDYKFVTRDELEDWGMSHLIGSNLLRAYMQGFFMDLRLYNRVKTASEPHAYEKYVQNQVTSKIDAKRANRITVSKRLPAVNKDLAQLLLSQPKQKRDLQEVDGEEGQGEKAQGMISNPLGDDRFASMFTNPGFQIDTESFEFQRLNPNKNHRFKNVAGANSDNEDRSSDDEEAKSRSDPRFERADQDGDSDTDDDIVYRKDGKSSKLLMGKIGKPKKAAAGDEDDEDEDSEEDGEGAGSSLYPSKRKKPAMFQLKRGVEQQDLLTTNVPSPPSPASSPPPLIFA
jgi:ribosome biogenesis protein ENP2